jgi:hypothetical protein
MTLLFRFGTKQTARFTWSRPDQEPADGAALVKSRAAAWGVKSDLADQAAASVAGVLGHIESMGLPVVTVDVTVSYDGLDLVTDMRCAADISAAKIAARAPALVGGETDNEESAAWVGLQNYLSSVYADRKRIYKARQQVGIELQFISQDRSISRNTNRPRRDPRYFPQQVTVGRGAAARHGPNALPDR